MMNRAINISLNASFCHAVDRVGDMRVRFKCATAFRLCAAPAVHVSHYDQHPLPVSAHVRRRLEKKLRHLASLRLVTEVIGDLGPQQFRL